MDPTEHTHKGARALFVGSACLCVVVLAACSTHRLSYVCRALLLHAPGPAAAAAVVPPPPPPPRPTNRHHSGCRQWVNYFLHSGHLEIEGLKMSKSLKNFITIR
jgi:hypothetical protein